MSVSPVALPLIAEHLRDGTWLDLRVCHEEDFITLENVKVTEYVIRADEEQVMVVQEWAGEDDAMLRQELALDAESIRWMRATSHDPTTATPYDPMPPEQRRSEDEWGIVVAAMAKNEGCTTDDVRHFWTPDGSNSYVHWRHKTILVAYHVTDMDPVEICKRVGYASVQPLLSAGWKWSKDDDKTKMWRSRLRDTCEWAVVNGAMWRPEERRRKTMWVL
jgi:hypothetical protein